ncbi:hypothetical protein ES703_102617 [subsurface metagenome]
MPRTVTITRLSVRRVNTILATSKASFLVFVVRYSVKTGINAMVREPSAKSRLSRLGMRRATKKASAAMPEPKRLAITISRTRPRIRLRKV